MSPSDSTYFPAFINPLPRPPDRHEQLILRLGKQEFLAAVEYAASRVLDPLSGNHWTFDGYRSYALYLRVNRPLSELDLVVEFGLSFNPGRVTLSLASPHEYEYLLFSQLAGQLAIRLSK